MMAKPNEENLIALVDSAKNGNKDAFSELYEYYITPIFRFVYFRVRSRADAEDLTQGIFLKVWTSLPGYKQKNRFSSWLYAVARNTVIDFWKKKKDWNISELGKETIKDKSKPIDETVDEERDLEKIRDLMELLTDEQQEIMILKFIQGLSNREISKILGKSEDALRQLQMRAIKTLKEYLKEKL